jgi:hypothetical protein
MRLSYFLAALGCCCNLLQAQGSNGAVSGIVLDRESKTPIRRAVVTLSTMERPPQDAAAWTDASGRFAFGYLPAGRYQLRVQKDGYQPAVFGADASFQPPATITLAAGENRGDLVFRLWRPGAISGVVLDDDGDPVPHVEVMMLTPGFQRQKRRLMPGMRVTTDSNGRFRAYNLAPGRYAVAMRRPFQPALKSQSEVVAGRPQTQYVYGIQYYPGTDRSESAALLTVAAGKEIENVSFRLSAKPSVNLRGRIVLPPDVAPPDPVTVNVVDPEPGAGMIMGGGASGPNRSFQFPNVVAGTYVLVAQAQAQGKRYRGVSRVEAGGDTSEIVIPLEPGIELTGSVLTEGPDASKHPATYVSLVPGDGLPWNGPPLRTRVDKDGSFKLTSVPSGIWDIDAGPIPPNGYFKSMRLGDQDVLTEEMAITPSTSASLKIVISTEGASVEGEVHDAGGAPTRAMVLLAPEGKLRNVSGFYRPATTDEKGHFEIKGQPPGRYKLYAFDRLNPNRIQDPEFLKPVEEQGIPVELSAGQKTSQKLVLIVTGAEMDR